MSTTGSPSKEKKRGVSAHERPNKGKAKHIEPADDAMDEDEDEEEDEEMEEYPEEDEDEDEDEEDDPEIDPRAIVGRRTRGIKVDYTSKEALDKAGLKPEGEDDDDEEK